MSTEDFFCPPAPDEPAVISWPIEDGDVKFYNRTVQVYDKDLSVDRYLPKSQDFDDMKPGIAYDVSDLQPFCTRLMRHIGYDPDPAFARYVFGNLRFEVCIRSKYGPGRGIIAGRFFEDGTPVLFIARTEVMVRVLEREFKIEDPKYRLSPIYAVEWLNGKVCRNRGHKIYGPIGVDAKTGKKNVLRVQL